MDGNFCRETSSFLRGNRDRDAGRGGGWGGQETCPEKPLEMPLEVQFQPLARDERESREQPGGRSVPGQGLSQGNR